MKHQNGTSESELWNLTWKIWKKRLKRDHSDGGISNGILNINVMQFNAMHHWLTPIWLNDAQEDDIRHQTCQRCNHYYYYHKQYMLWPHDLIIELSPDYIITLRSINEFG